MTPLLTGPIAITGADGHVGSHLQARLRALTNEVRPLGRRDEPSKALRDAVAVVHLAGTLAPRGHDTYEAANVETVRRTLAALEGSPVRRVVFLSYPGADPGAHNDYLRSKGEAEQLVLACGREAVIVRSTFIYGPPGDPGPSAAPFVSSGGAPVSVIGTGMQRWAPVHVDDVVETLVRFALDPTTPTGTFSLAGPDILTVDALVDAINGSVVKKRHLGRRVARMISYVVPTLNPTMVDVLAADSLADGSPRATEVLGASVHHLWEQYPHTRNV